MAESGSANWALPILVCKSHVNLGVLFCSILSTETNRLKAEKPVMRKKNSRHESMETLKRCAQNFSVFVWFAMWVLNLINWKQFTPTVLLLAHSIAIEKKLLFNVLRASLTERFLNSLYFCDLIKNGFYIFKHFLQYNITIIALLILLVTYIAAVSQHLDISDS